MAKQRTLQQLREAFIGAEGLGAAAVMVRVPQALALLDCADVLSIQECRCRFIPQGSSNQSPPRHCLRCNALAKLKEAGVTI